MEQGQVVIGAKLETKDFDREIEHLEEKLEGLIEEYEILSKENPTENQAKNLQNLSHEILNTKEKISKLTKEKERFNQTNFSSVSSQLTGIGNGIESVIKKVTRWGLAVFGIRSAYNFIRSSISTLSQYNEGIATDIEYIRFALATTLQPIIERIIQLAYTLLQYIGYIAKAWFGVNIFANATVDAFQKQKKAMGGTVKQAKELQKTLAGFDEMNILQEDGSIKTGGGGGGIPTPSVNLGEIGEFDNITGIETWLKKARDAFNKTFDDIEKNIIKVMKNLGFSQDYINAFKMTAEGIKKIFNGVGEFIFGFGQTIVGILTGDTELVKKGFENLGSGIKTTFTGILQAIIGIHTQIIAIVTDTFKKIPELMYNLFIKKGNKSFEDFKNETQQKFRSMVDNIRNLFTNLGSAVGSVLGNAFKSVINAVLRKIESTLNVPISAINSLTNIINKYTPFKLGRLSTFSLPRLAKGGIVNLPSRGVPIGGAIAGESGQEGVIPLTDSQQMALLGEAIGKYITINATIPVYAYNRQVAREVRRVEANQSFATNGR